MEAAAVEWWRLKRWLFLLALLVCLFPWFFSCNGLCLVLSSSSLVDSSSSPVDAVRWLGGGRRMREANLWHWIHGWTGCFVAPTFPTGTAAAAERARRRRSDVVWTRRRLSFASGEAKERRERRCCGMQQSGERTILRSAARNGVHVPYEVGLYGQTEILHQPDGSTLIHAWLPAIEAQRDIHCGVYDVSRRYQQNVLEIHRRLLPKDLLPRRYGRDAVDFMERYLRRPALAGPPPPPAAGGDTTRSSETTVDTQQRGDEGERNQHENDGCLTDQKKRLPEGVVVPWRPITQGLGAPTSPACPLLVISAPKNQLVQKWEESLFTSRQAAGRTDEYLWIQRCYRLHESHDPLKVTCQYSTACGVLRIYIPVKDASPSSSTAESAFSAGGSEKLSTFGDIETERGRSLSESGSTSYDASHQHLSSAGAVELPIAYTVQEVEGDADALIRERSVRRSTWIYNWDKFAKYDTSVDFYKTDLDKAAHVLQGEQIATHQRRADEAKTKEKEKKSQRLQRKRAKRERRLQRQRQEGEAHRERQQEEKENEEEEEKEQEEFGQ